MNKEEILKMTAGEELDDMIATKIMNWNVKSKLFGEEYEDYWHDGKKFTSECTWFKPSSDISAAWEVFLKVDHDKERSKVVHLSFDQWVCCFDDIKSPDCKTAPEAICKAALLTLMEETA